MLNLVKSLAVVAGCEPVDADSPGGMFLDEVKRLACLCVPVTTVEDMAHDIADHVVSLTPDPARVCCDLGAYSVDVSEYEPINNSVMLARTKLFVLASRLAVTLYELQGITDND